MEAWILNALDHQEVPLTTLMAAPYYFIPGALRHSRWYRLYMTGDHCDKDNFDTILAAFSMKHSQPCLISYLNESLVIFEQSENQRTYGSQFPRAHFKYLSLCFTFYHVSKAYKFFPLSGTLNPYMWMWLVSVVCAFSHC